LSKLICFNGAIEYKYLRIPALPTEFDNA